MNAQQRHRHAGVFTSSFFTILSPKFTASSATLLIYPASQPTSQPVMHCIIIMFHWHHNIIIIISSIHPGGLQHVTVQISNPKSINLQRRVQVLRSQAQTTPLSYGACASLWRAWTSFLAVSWVEWRSRLLLRFSWWRRMTSAQLLLSSSLPPELCCHHVSLCPFGIVHTRATV